MRLQVLGCGDAFGSGGRFNACFHLSGPQGAFLVDCGATALVAMRRFGVDPGGIDAVFVRHLHGDHFGGLPWLILDAHHVTRRTRPLVIAGPTGTRARLQAAMEALYPGSSTSRRPFEIVFHDLEAGATRTVGPVSVAAFPADHPSGAPSLALRLSVAGKVIAYTGDTAWVEDLVALGREADLLIAE